MKATTIWDNLVSTLENNPTLSDYVKQVFKGKRFEVEPDSLPCIMLEPISDGELERQTNNIENVYFNVDVFAFSHNNVNDFEKTIVGDELYKGILDINNDIRACLHNSYSLGGSVLDVRPGTTVFDQLDLGKYPVRGLLMPLRILYRQVEGV